MENYAMMVDEEKKVFTIADIEALPEGERAELINGEMFMMATPSITHQRISGNLFFDIKDYTRSKGGSCEPFAAPAAIITNRIWQLCVIRRSLMKRGFMAGRIG